MPVDILIRASRPNQGNTTTNAAAPILQTGRAACDSPLIDKEKLEKAVLDQIQDQILSEQNVRE
jgi:hypothetical protein